MKQLASLTLLVMALFSPRIGWAESAVKIDYNRQIRPLLSNNCFKCHGPDAAERQAELRLDQRDSALQPTESGGVAVVPGNPDESELIKRIFAESKAERMPPASENKQLSAADKQLLKQWIAEGAVYTGH